MVAWIGPVEVAGLEDLDDVGDGVLGEQHAAQHALLGGDVLRRRLVVAALALRRRGILRCWAGWAATAHVVADRHGSPLSYGCTITRT